MKKLKKHNRCVEKAAFDVLEERVLFNVYVMSPQLRNDSYNVPANGVLVINEHNGVRKNDSRGFSYTDNPNPNPTPVIIDPLPPSNEPSLEEILKRNINLKMLFNTTLLSNDERLNTAVSIKTLPSHGTLQFNTDGSFSYAPNAGYTGIDTFVYYLGDENTLIQYGDIYKKYPGMLKTATVTLNVVNGTALNKDYYNVYNNTLLTVDAANGLLSNDASTSPMEVINVQWVPNYIESWNEDGTPVYDTDHKGNLTVNPDGSFTYTPQAEYWGRDLYSYQVGDVISYVCFGTNPSFYIWEIDTIPTVYTPVEINHAPTKMDRTIHRIPESPITLNPGNCFDDPDDDVMAFSITVMPKHGTATINDNGTPGDSSDDFIEYIPENGFYGEDVFTLTANDGKETASSLVTVQTQRAGLKPNSKNPSKQDLIVLGTDGNDTIKLLINKKGQVKVLLNGESQGLFRATGSIVVKSLAGDDVVDASKLALPVRIYGGDGNDKLLGSAVKCSRIFGGAGNDVMSGISHKSTFFDGGKGRNVINFYPSFDISQE